MAFTDEKKMELAAEMGELLNDYAQEVAQGVLLRNIRSRFERNGASPRLAEILTASVERRANDFSHYAVR